MTEKCEQLRKQEIILRRRRSRRKLRNRLNIRQRSEAEARHDSWTDKVEELWPRGDLCQLSVEQLRATLRRKGLGIRSAVRRTEPLQRLGAIPQKEDPEIRRRQHRKG